MRGIFRCALCLTAAACVNLMPPNMKPAAIDVPGKSFRFAGDTLILAISNRSQTPSVSAEVRSAIAATVRSAFPAAVVLDSVVDSAPAPRRVFITTTLVQYGASWEGSRWIGHTGLDVFVQDHHVSSHSGFVDLIRTSSASSIVNMGNKTIGDVSRASFDSASMTLIAFLDSLDDPSTRDKLFSTAGVSDTEYAPYLAPTGNSSLTGRAFITDAGSEHPAAGQPVTLDPATSSSRRWYERAGMDWTLFNSGSPDDLFRSTRRTMMTDSHGQFAFSGLQPGTYIVRVRVDWEAPDPNDLFHSVRPFRAVVAAVVRIEEGVQKQIAVNQTGNAFLH